MSEQDQPKNDPNCIKMQELLEKHQQKAKKSSILHKKGRNDV